MKTRPAPSVGKYLIANKVLTACNDFDFAKLDDGPAIYEVVRIIDNIPLFIEDHLTRMKNSAQLLGHNAEFHLRDIAAQMQLLAKRNDMASGNIKWFCSFSTQPFSLLIFFIPHFYPQPENYAMGITMQSLIAERPNPNAKIVNTSLTEKAALLKKTTGVDEILLVNHEMKITEGSKSNIFFTKGDQVLTPERKQVLAGITREKVLKICKDSGILCSESKIDLDELQLFSGAFITGTSPKVMPVRSIDNFLFDTQLPVIQEIRKKYDAMISSYLKNYKL